MVVGAGCCGVTAVVVFVAEAAFARCAAVHFGCSSITYFVPSAVLTRVTFSPSFRVVVAWPLSYEPPTTPISADLPSLAIERRRKMFSLVGNVPF